MNSSTEVLICSIDVGFSNLGISLSKVQLRPKFHLVEVVRVHTFDLAKVTLRTCRPTKCVQHGQRCFAHHVKHFVEEQRSNYFDPAELILIERQPRTVYTAIEQLLHYIFPSKVLLQSPISLHSWMGTLGKPRPEKKAESLRRALPYIQHLPGFVKHESWRHDQADTICYLLYYLEKQKEEQVQKGAEMKSNKFRALAFDQTTITSKYF